MAASTALTPQTFAKLTPHPFLLANLQQPSSDVSNVPNASNSSGGPVAAAARTNGRAPHEPRLVHVNASSLSHAHGSAMVRVGDTSAICGIRGEILPATNIPQWRAPKTLLERESMSDDDRRAESAREMRDYDLLVPNIELATGCAPQFLPGVPPTSLAQTLSTRIYSLLHTAGLVDVEDLRVWYQPPDMEAGGNDGEKAKNRSDMDDEGVHKAEAELKGYWTLYIDVMFVSFDGNPFDAAWAAIVAALRDTKLPRAWWDADREMVLCSRKDSRALNITGLPVACTVAALTEKEKEGATREEGQGKRWLLVDPDRDEEKLCEESVTAVVDRSGGETRIRGISKAGGRTLGPKEIRDIVNMAESKWEGCCHELLK